MSKIRAKNTKPEILLRKALWKNGIKGYRLHWNKALGRPDIAFPGRKIAIFVNGCYWHRCPYCNPSFPKTHQDFWKVKFQKNVERDKKKIINLQKMDWKIIVVWECQIYTDLATQINCIRLLLNEK